MILIGDKKEMILLVKPPGSWHYRLVCFGRKAHYRKDGSCKHTENVLQHVRPSILKRVKLEPFGGKPNASSTRSE